MIVWLVSVPFSIILPLVSPLLCRRQKLILQRLPNLTESHCNQLTGETAHDISQATISTRQFLTSVSPRAIASQPVVTRKTARLVLHQAPLSHLLNMDPLQGNCHCGHFRFQLSANLGDAIICACTLCTKLGCLWLRATPDTFTVTRDEGSLAEYQGTKFCGKCGTAVTGEHQAGPLQGQLLVNARTVWGFDPFKIG